MIYISGGITGIAFCKLHFDKAESYLKSKGCVPINPHKICSLLPTLSHSEYMTVCMALLSLCDTIYMLKGYERSKGAMVELEYAREHGYKVVNEDDRSNVD